MTELSTLFSYLKENKTLGLTLVDGELWDMDTETDTQMRVQKYWGGKSKNNTPHIYQMRIKKKYTHTQASDNVKFSWAPDSIHDCNNSLFHFEFLHTTMSL